MSSHSTHQCRRAVHGRGWMMMILLCCCCVLLAVSATEAVRPRRTLMEAVEHRRRVAVDRVAAVPAIATQHDDAHKTPHDAATDQIEHLVKKLRKDRERNNGTLHSTPPRAITELNAATATEMEMQPPFIIAGVSTNVSFINLLAGSIVQVWSGAVSCEDSNHAIVIASGKVAAGSTSVVLTLSGVCTQAGMLQVCVLPPSPASAMHASSRTKAMDVLATTTQQRQQQHHQRGHQHRVALAAREDPNDGPVLFAQGGTILILHFTHASSTLTIGRVPAMMYVGVRRANGEGMISAFCTNPLTCGSSAEDEDSSSSDDVLLQPEVVSYALSFLEDGFLFVNPSEGSTSCPDWASVSGVATVPKAEMFISTNPASNRHLVSATLQTTPTQAGNYAVCLASRNKEGFYSTTGAGMSLWEATHIEPTESSSSSNRESSSAVARSSSSRSASEPPGMLPTTMIAGQSLTVTSLRLNTGRSAIASDPLCETIISLTPPSTTISIIRDGKSVLTVPTCTTQTSGYYCEAEGLSGAAVLENRGVMNIISLYDCFSMQYLNILTAVQLPARPVTQYGVAPGFGRMHFLSLSSACDTSPALQQLEEEGIVTEQLHSTPLNYYYVCVESADGTLNFTTSLPSLEIVSFLMTSYIATVNVRQKMRLIPKTYAPEDSFVIATELPHDGGNNLWVPDTDLVYEGPCGDGYVVPNISASELTGANGTTVILPTLVPQILTICARSNLFRKNANTLLRGRFFVPVQTFLAILPPVVSSIAPTSPVLSHSMACFSVSVPGNIYSMVPTVDGTNPEYVLYRPYYRHDVGPRVMNLVAVDEDELELAQAHHDNYCAQRSTVTASPTIASPMASAFGSPVAVCFNTMHLPAGTYAVCASTPNGLQTVVQPVHLTSATVSPTEVVAGSITSFKVTPTMPLTSFLVAPLSEDGNCTWSSSSPTFTTDDNGNGEVRLVFTYADGRVAALPAGNYSLCFAYPLPRTRGLATTSPAFQWAQLAVLEVHGADFFSVSVGALVLGVPTDVYLTEDLTAPMLKPGFYTSCAETAQPVSNTVASWTADDESDVLIHVVTPTQTQPAMQSAAEGVVATGANNAPVPTLFLCARAPLNQTLCAVPALGLAVVNQPMRLPVTPQPTCSQVNLYFAVSSAATQWAQVELATGGCCYSRLANPSSATPSYVVQQGYRLGSGYRAFLLNDKEVDALDLSDYSICVSNWSTYNGLHRCLDVGTLAVWRNLSLCDVNPHFLPITIIAPRETLGLPQPWSRANYLVLIIILAAGGAVVFVSLVVCLITKLCTRHGAQQVRRAIKTAAADLDEEESPSRRAVEVPRKGGEWPWATVGSFDGAAPSTTPTTKHRQHTASRLPRGLSLANPDAAVEPMRTWLVDVPADPLTAERVLRCLSTPMAGLTANTSAPYAASDAASEDVVKKAIVYEGTTSDGDALTTTTTQPEPHTVEEVVAYELDSRRMILDHEDDALLTLLVQERRLWKETRRAASVGGSVQRSTLLEHDPFWSGQFDAVDAASIRALRAVSGYVVGEDSPRSPTDLAHEEDGSDDDTFTRTNTSALLTAMDEGVRHAAPRGIPVGPSEPLFTPASARNEQPNERSPSLHQPEYVEETPAGRALVAPQHAFSPASAEREDSVPASAPVDLVAAVPTSEDTAFSPASVPREEQPNAQPVERSPSLHQPEFVAETPAGRAVAPQDVFSPASAEREDSVPAVATKPSFATTPAGRGAAPISMATLYSPASVPREEQPHIQPVERSPSLHQPEFVAETPAGRALVAPQDAFSPASAEREDSMPASAPVDLTAAVPTSEEAAFSPASVPREEQPNSQPVERSPSLHQPEFVAETPAGRGVVAPQDAFSPASAEREDSVPAMDAKPLSSTTPTGRGAAPISVATLYSPASVPREEQPNSQPVERSPSLHQPEFVAETPAGRALVAPQDVFSPASAEREDSMPASAPVDLTAAVPTSEDTAFSPASVPREEQPNSQPVERSPSLHQPEFVAETPAGRAVAPQDVFSPASAEREDSVPAVATKPSFATTPAGRGAAPISMATLYSPASVPREEQPTAQPVERSPSLHQPEFVAETPAGRAVAPHDVFSPASAEREDSVPAVATKPSFATTPAGRGAAPISMATLYSPASVPREEQPNAQPVERSPSLHQPEFVAETPAGRALVAPQDVFSPASAEREDSMPASAPVDLTAAVPTSEDTAFSPASVPREEQPNSQPVERSPSLHQPEFVAETPAGRAVAPQDVFSPASAEREDSVPAVATKPSFATTPAGRGAAPISMATLYSPASVPREEQPTAQPVERSPSLHQPEFVAETPAGRGVVAPQDVFSPPSVERDE